MPENEQIQQRKLCLKSLKRKKSLKKTLIVDVTNLMAKQSKSENKNSPWWIQPTGYTVDWNHTEYLV